MNVRSQPGYIFHRGRAGNANPIGTKHDTGAQGNVLGNLHMNPPAGNINVPARQTPNMSVFVKPGKPQRLIRQYTPITAHEFKRIGLHSSGESSAESHKRHE